MWTRPVFAIIWKITSDKIFKLLFEGIINNFLLSKNQGFSQNLGFGLEREQGRNFLAAYRCKLTGRTDIKELYRIGKKVHDYLGLSGVIWNSNQEDIGCPKKVVH